MGTGTSGNRTALPHMGLLGAYWALMIFLAVELAYFQPRSLRFLRHISSAPKSASGPSGAAKTPSPLIIGAAIGSLMGASLQVVLIMGVVSSIDPTSQFPIRLPII